MDGGGKDETTRTLLASIENEVSTQMVVDDMRGLESFVGRRGIVWKQCWCWLAILGALGKGEHFWNEIQEV